MKKEGSAISTDPSIKGELLDDRAGRDLGQRGAPSSNTSQRSQQTAEPETRSPTSPELARVVLTSGRRLADAVVAGFALRWFALRVDRLGHAVADVCSADHVLDLVSDDRTWFIEMHEQLRHTTE